MVLPARDAVGTAVHGAWGSFWLGWGLLVGLATIGAVPVLALESQAFGFWFIGLAVVTGFAALAALSNNLAQATVLWLLTAGTVLLAVGLIGGMAIIVVVGGWVLVFSAGAAFYTAGAMMLSEATAGRTVLPLGTLSTAGNIPGRRVSDPIGYAAGMPGAKVGQ